MVRERYGATDQEVVEYYVERGEREEDVLVALEHLVKSLRVLRYGVRVLW